MAHDMLITVAMAMAAGVILIVLARKLDLPAIVLLLAGGIVLGPQVLGDYAVIRADTLGPALTALVSLFVGLILFEGGLTLDLQGYRSAPKMIKRLLSLGVVVTFFGNLLAVRYLLDVPLPIAALMSSLVVVTGPTVIAPLLRRIRVAPKLHGILHWEGVLIDPIGVFIALLCFELVVSGKSGSEAAIALLVRTAAGLGLGAAGGGFIVLALRKHFVPENMASIFALGGATLVFGAAEAIQSEAGLLAVTVAGFVVGLSGAAAVPQIKEFKAELTDLLIGTLFILLASRLKLEQFLELGVAGAIAVAIAMVVVRPISVLLCSARTDMTWRERAFLGWVAPRGIVAASMASVFAISMPPESAETARVVEAFAYAVIVATIVLQGLTAGPVARMLGLRRPEARGWLIVGAHRLGRKVAEFLAEHGAGPAILIDTNTRMVQSARREGLTAFEADARDTEIAETEDFQLVGNVLALTDNEDLNVRLCEVWLKVVGRDHVFRCDPVDDERRIDTKAAGEIVWGGLPRPSQLAGEIRRGDALLSDREIDEEGRVPGGLPLMNVRGERVTIGGDTAPEPGDRVLMLQRSAQYLASALHADLIIDVEATTLTAVIEQLVARVGETYPEIDQHAIVGAVIEQGAAFPLMVGQGVAVPHALVNGLDRRVAAIARIPGGLHVETPDSAPIQLVFLVLEPPGDPEGHLGTLAEIARLVLAEDVRDQLSRATPGDLVNLVRQTVR